jgi:uncharacterized membrane protein YagU involved in acid resistance
MSISDGVGFLAAAFTLLTFLQTAMVPMRFAAIAATLSFISYGALAGCLPVLVLHLILLPVNGYRVWASMVQQLAETRPGSACLPGRSEGLI